MIKYDRLWQTMKQRGVSQYDLYCVRQVKMLAKGPQKG